MSRTLEQDRFFRVRVRMRPIDKVGAIGVIDRVLLERTEASGVHLGGLIVLSADFNSICFARSRFGPKAKLRAEAK